MKGYTQHLFWCKILFCRLLQLLRVFIHCLILIHVLVLFTSLGILFHLKTDCFRLKDIKIPVRLKKDVSVRIKYVLIIYAQLH